MSGVLQWHEKGEASLELITAKRPVHQRYDGVVTTGSTYNPAFLTCLSQHSTHVLERGMINISKISDSQPEANTRPCITIVFLTC